MSTEEPREESKQAPTGQEQPSCEIPLSDSMSKLLNDEELADVKLEGNDGVQIFAHRLVLASRSLVFRHMLYGHFKESTSNIVKVDYAGKVVEAIVRYCYTDKPGILKSCENDEEAIPYLISLVGAADFFGLTKLSQRAMHWALLTVTKKPTMVCTFLRESRIVGASANCIFARAMSSVRMDPSDTLVESKDLVSLQASIVEEIIKDPNISADEVTMFAILKTWSDAEGPPTAEKGLAQTENSASIDEARTRQDIAKDLAKYIRLDKIPPSILSTEVASSDLVPLGRVFEAYKAQAFALEAAQGSSFKKYRFTHPVWSKTKTVLVSSENLSELNIFGNESHPYGQTSVSTLLRGVVMKSGIYTWSIQVEQFEYQEGADYELDIGVVSASHPFEHSTQLGSHIMGWAYGIGSGCCYSGGVDLTKGHPKCTAGSIVTMILDLRAESSNGSLSACVNHGPIFELCSGLLDNFDKRTPAAPAAAPTASNPFQQPPRNNSRNRGTSGTPPPSAASLPVGLIPAVSLPKKSRVRFLGFDAIHP